ncbi:MAG TPA: transcriptional regulator NrdR [Solirubrobacterales bacterium]|nr:transcriptional regulator NrdR [Solirubrobacterales bacterium]
MDCPRCDRDTRVLESRRGDGGAALRRRRECLSCGYRFTTFERREREPAYVRKRDGRRQRFDRTKLRAALLGASHKRPVSARDVEALVNAIEAEIGRAGGELAAERIAALCLERLRELDPGAYLQFAGTLPSANPDFAAIDSGGSIRPDRQPSSLPAETTS